MNTKSRRSLRPHYNTIDGKFGTKPLRSHTPVKINYVQREKDKICAILRNQFNPKIHEDTDASAYANRMYNNFVWVDCLTTADRRLETRKDSDELVFRYCANRKTIPPQVPEDDIHEIQSPFKSTWCTKEQAFGYGYYIQKFTDSSGLRIIEQDILANYCEGCCADAQNACDYRTDFMSYYNDEFTSNDYNEQLQIETEQLEEFLRQEKNKESEKLREMSWLDLDVQSYSDTDTISPMCSPTTNEKRTNNNDECIVIICGN
jgi:hypothetical protein